MRRVEAGTGIRFLGKSIQPRQHLGRASGALRRVHAGGFERL